MTQIEWPKGFKGHDLVEEAALNHIKFHLDISESEIEEAFQVTNKILQNSNNLEKVIGKTGSNFYSIDFVKEAGFYDIDKTLELTLRKDSKDITLKATAMLLSFYHALHWFAETRNNPGVKGKLMALKKLSSTEITDESSLYNANVKQLAFLGSVIKAEALDAIGQSDAPKIARLKEPHIAGFGTGGDGLHTINLTTLVMPIAAAYYNQIGRPQGDKFFAKLSTTAITGTIGGADVANRFLSEINTPDNFDIIKLGELGFPYSKEIVQARREFTKAEQEDSIYRVDPYKVIYPPANLSQAAHVVTGTHPELDSVAREIADIIRQVGNQREGQLFVTSKIGNDEFMVGSNTVNIASSEPFKISEIDGLKKHFSERQLQLAQDFLKEQPNKALQARRMHEILGVVSPKHGVAFSGNVIVAVNAALFLPEVIESVREGKAPKKVIEFHTRGIMQMLEKIQQGEIKENPFVNLNRNLSR